MEMHNILTPYCNNINILPTTFHQDNVKKEIKFINDNITLTILDIRFPLVNVFFFAFIRHIIQGGTKFRINTMHTYNNN